MENFEIDLVEGLKNGTLVTAFKPGEVIIVEAGKATRDNGCNELYPYRAAELAENGQASQQVKNALKKVYG